MQKPYPAKMRRLRLLVVLSSPKNQAKQVGTPGKAKDEPLPGVPFCLFFRGMLIETTGAGGRPVKLLEFW